MQGQEKFDFMELEGPEETRSSEDITAHNEWKRKKSEARARFTVMQNLPYDVKVRKAVLEALQKEDLEFMQQSDLQEIIENCINNISTAYKVNRVVEQIKDMRFDFQEVSGNKHRVLKIIEAGGVNE